MHKLVWNRMEFPIQEKREECFRNQNSLLPVFLQHKHHESAHSQEEREDTLSSDLLMVRHDGKKLLLQLGRFAMEGLPANFALLTTRPVCGWSPDGAAAITKHRSLSCSGILLWALSLATPGEFPRDGTKMQHALSAWRMFSPWGLFIKMKLLCLSGGGGEKEPRVVQRKRECCIFFLPSWVSGLSLLTEGVCLTKQAGTCWHTWSSFLIGSSNGETCLGIFYFSPPQYSRFSGKSSS